MKEKQLIFPQDIRDETTGTKVRREGGLTLKQAAALAVYPVLMKSFLDMATSFTAPEKLEANLKTCSEAAWTYATWFVEAEK